MGLLKEYILNSREIHDTDADILHMKYLCDTQGFNTSDKLWYCFLFGLVDNIFSALLLLQNFPKPENININDVRDFFKENSKAIIFGSDKQKCKPYAPDTINDYINVIGKDVDGFLKQYKDKTPKEVFDDFWINFNEIKGFGRFSKWNFLQALKWCDVLDNEPPFMFLGDGKDINFIEGLYYELGHYEKLSKRIDGKKVYYNLTQNERDFYEDYCLRLCEETNIDLYELETCVCSFKKLFRNHKSEYVGLTNDEIYEAFLDTKTHDIYKDMDFMWFYDYRKKYNIHINTIRHERFNEPPHEKIKYKSLAETINDF